jgi:hypothetical protein
MKLEEIEDLHDEHPVRKAMSTDTVPPGIHPSATDLLTPHNRTEAMKICIKAGMQID